jgi:hypothetical protein
MSKQTRGAILFTHEVKRLVRVYYDTHAHKILIMCLLGRLLTNYLIFKKKKVDKKLTLMESNEVIHIN